jgi:predicted transcriptional regulator
MRLALLNICFVILSSCGNDSGKTTVVESENTNQKTPITARAIESFDYQDYVLSTEGEKAVANWEKYQELAIQISYLKKADLSFFNGDRELLKTFLDELKLGLPKDLSTNPIISRTVIIETAALRFNDNFTLDNISDKDKLESVKEVIVAFSNLNYQINKKIERDKFDKIKSEY